MATGGALAIGDLPLLNCCLNRHVRADWGHVCEEDAKTNDEAVQAGFRILSAYAIDERPGLVRVMATTRSGSSRRPTAA